MDLDYVRHFVSDLNELLGVQDSCPASDNPDRQKPSAGFESPEELQQFFRGIFVDVFGLKVEGL